MMYLLAAIFILMVAFLCLRVRVRLQLSPEQRILFVGLGRTGPEIDFARGKGSIRVCGLRVFGFGLERSERGPRSETPRGPVLKSRGESSRRRSFRAVMTTLPRSLSAFWRFGIGLLRSTIVEQAEAEIEAGFDTPDLTGQAFGYYQAAVAAAPGFFGRIAFTPVWTGKTFSGSARLSLAWPVYRLLWQIWLLVWRLPKKELYRLAIGEKGVRDVEQQRG